MCECTYEITFNHILCVRLHFGFKFQKDVRNGFGTEHRKMMSKYPKKTVTTNDDDDDDDDDGTQKREENGKETPTH